MKAKTIALLVLVLVVGILLIQNSMAIPVRLLFWTMVMPVFFLALGVFALGFLAGFLAARIEKRREAKKKEGQAAPVPPASMEPPRPAAG